MFCLQTDWEHTDPPKQDLSCLMGLWWRHQPIRLYLWSPDVKKRKNTNLLGETVVNEKNLSAVASEKLMHLQAQFSHLLQYSLPQFTDPKLCSNGLIVKNVWCLWEELGRGFTILVACYEQRLLRTPVCRHAWTWRCLPTGMVWQGHPQSSGHEGLPTT